MNTSISPSTSTAQWWKNIPGLLSQLENDFTEDNFGDHVIVEVARNPETPSDILAQLLFCAHDDVWMSGNNCTRLVQMMVPSYKGTIRRDHYTEFGIMLALAKNPATPPQLLSQLARVDHDLEIRQAVAYNLSTPTEALLFLASDQGWFKSEAENTLEQQALLTK
jgi:hypothetical protein